MNKYLELWMEHQEQFQMPEIKTAEANHDGPYWTVDRAHNVHSAARQTRAAYSTATAFAAMDGPMPFMDVAAYSAATLYSAAWWIHALA